MDATVWDTKKEGFCPLLLELDVLHLKAVLDFSYIYAII